METPRTETILRYIAANVLRLRDARGWTQAQLAEKTGLTRRYVQLLETGQANPTVKVLIAVGDALGVAPEDFFAVTKIEPRPKVGRPTKTK